MRETTGIRAVLDTNVYLSMFAFPDPKIFDLGDWPEKGDTSS